MRKEVAVVNHSYESKQITTSKHVTIQTIPQGEHRRNKRLIHPISNLLKRMGMPIQVNLISTPRKKRSGRGCLVGESALSKTLKNIQKLATYCRYQRSQDKSPSSKNEASQKYARAGRDGHQVKTS